MKFIPEVDIPESLLEAQEKNKLVIFAGAGVSIPAPSNIPDFKELGNYVVEHLHLNEKPEKGESTEVFLGKLYERELAVHQVICERINAPESRPNDLHGALIRLFGPRQNLRMVTTNYDYHFSTIIKENDLNVEEYYAPALPPGEDFCGIAYIHGCAKKDPKNLVVTDCDFGKAYLIQRWALNFVYDLFMNNTVLFYGYSHEDAILRYLARALPPKSQRFAFSSEESAREWEFLGITPIICGQAIKVDKHGLQLKCIAAWSDHIHTGLLEHESRIKEIASSMPPLEVDKQDYLLYCLKERPTTRFFCRAAAHPIWLNWLNEKGVLKQLFEPYSQMTEIGIALSKWVADHFVSLDEDHVFNLIRNNGSKLNPDFWRQIVWQLSHGTPRPSSRTLCTWLNIILENVPDVHLHHDSLGFLLIKCNFQVHRNAAIRLFDYLLRPIAQVEPLFSLVSTEPNNKPAMDFRLRLAGEHYCLEEAWKKIFRPDISDCWRILLPIVQRHLTMAYIVNESIEHANKDDDRESWWRSAIEPHEQDRNPRDFDVLINAARDILEYVIANDADGAMRIINIWFNSGVPLLKRIAIHGIAQSNNLSDDEKINWLLDRNLLYQHPYKHEVFRVIKGSFAKCAEPIQQRLINSALIGPQQKEENVAQAPEL